MSKKARLALCYAAGSVGGRAGRPGSVAASAAVPGPSTGPALARPRLAHVDLAAGEVPAVQRRDRLVRLARRAHLDEAEAARAPRVAVRDDGGGFARPVLREERLEVRASGVERQVSDEDLLAHGILLPLVGRLWFCRGCLSVMPRSSERRRSGSHTNKRTGPLSSHAVRDASPTRTLVAGPPAAQAARAAARRSQTVPRACRCCTGGRSGRRARARAGRSRGSGARAGPERGGARSDGSSAPRGRGAPCRPRCCRSRGSAGRTSRPASPRASPRP